MGSSLPSAEVVNEVVEDGRSGKQQVESMNTGAIPVFRSTCSDHHTTIASSGWRLRCVDTKQTQILPVLQVTVSN